MTTATHKPKPSLLKVVLDHFRRDYDLSQPTSPGALSLQLALRRLWADHVIWTREYVVAAIADAPDAGAVAGRLLKNQEDLGNAVVPFYGEAAGSRLTELLKEHVMIAVDLVAAAKSGEQAKFAKADVAWDRNAANIASFLAGANPNWPEKDVADLLGQHLALTKNEAVARLKSSWENDIAAFDEIFTEILTVADVLAAGIVKQFPNRF
ncbi:MAG: glycosyltransferase [Candidatus Limnocylindrales bacterium]